MKGKILQIPILEPKKGMQVAFNKTKELQIGKIVGYKEDFIRVEFWIGYAPLCKLSELSQLVIEYEEDLKPKYYNSDVNPLAKKPQITKQLLLQESQWLENLENINKEVDFEILGEIKDLVNDGKWKSRIAKIIPQQEKFYNKEEIKTWLKTRFTENVPISYIISEFEKEF